MNLGKSPNRTAAIAELFGLLGNAVIEKISTSTAAQVTETDDHAVYGEYVTMPQGFTSSPMKYKHPHAKGKRL